MAKKSLIEKTIEAPAKSLDQSIKSTKKIVQSLPGNNVNPIQKAKDYWYTLGPGLTTGASDDDPSGIATYSQTGAQTGFKFLWMASFSFPLMAVIQELCARIGLVTGRGLAANIRNHFGKKVLYISTLLLFIANTFNIGADIGAMASAVQLLKPSLNFGLLVVSFTIFIVLIQIFTPYSKYAKYLKWLALILIAYIFSALLSHPNWHTVAKYALLPNLNLNKNDLLLFCAILGTTITPYLFFWQTSQEVEEEISAGQTTLAQRQETSKDQIKKMRIDIWSGMFLSNLVMFFIIAACASVLYSHGIFNVNTASQAAQALKPFAGNLSFWLFAIGIMGVALLAIPVMAGASAYAISESLGKKQGLNHKLHQAYSFYGVIIISMLIGLGLNFVGLNPIKALIYAAALNGIIAPIIIILILLLARNKKIMREWKIGKISSIIGWITAILMILAGIGAIYSLIP